MTSIAWEAVPVWLGLGLIAYTSAKLLAARSTHQRLRALGILLFVGGMLAGNVSLLASFAPTRASELGLRGVAMVLLLSSVLVLVRARRAARY